MPGPAAPDAQMLADFQDPSAHDMGIGSIGDFAAGSNTSAPAETTSEVKAVYVASC